MWCWKFGNGLRTLWRRKLRFCCLRNRLCPLLAVQRWPRYCFIWKGIEKRKHRSLLKIASKKSCLTIFGRIENRPKQARDGISPPVISGCAGCWYDLWYNLVLLVLLLVMLVLNWWYLRRQTNDGRNFFQIFCPSWESRSRNRSRRGMVCQLQFGWIVG